MENNLKIDSFYQLPVLKQMLEGNKIIGNLFIKINLNSILVASDHAGYQLKESIIKYLLKKIILRMD